MAAPLPHQVNEPSAMTYVLVWLALVALATLALFVSSTGLAIALAIGAAKAVLVAAFFMHLAHGQPVHRLAFALAVIFLALLVLGVAADVATRDFASAYVDH